MSDRSTEPAGPTPTPTADPPPAAERSEAELIAAALPLLRALKARLDADPAARSAAVGLSRFLLSESTATADAAEPTQVAPPPPTPQPEASPPARPPRQELREIHLGDVHAEVMVAHDELVPRKPSIRGPIRVDGDGPTTARPSTRPPTRDLREPLPLDRATDRGNFDAGFDTVDLRPVPERLRLKTEALRWTVQRETLRRNGTPAQELAAREDDFDRRGRDMGGVDLWMLHHQTRLPGEDEVLRLAALFENMTLAAEVGIAAEDHGDAQPPMDWEALLQIIAETQSAVRIAVADVTTWRDSDQFTVYQWLRDQTSERRIFVHRHMRLDDPADPDHWEAVRDDLIELRDTWQAERDLRAGKKQRMNKAKYHARRLADAFASGEEGEEHDWESLMAAVDEMVDAGDQPPSAKPLRELLLPLIDGIPEDLQMGKGAELALREVDLYVAQQEEKAASEGEVARDTEEPSEELLRARELLRGRVVVLIGGEARTAAKESLEQSLQLAELRWVATQEHKSIAPLETEVNHDDVDLVLLAIRWASHAYGDIVETCKARGVPLVRLPAGYSPNRVAHDVLAQASEQLASLPATG